MTHPAKGSGRKPSSWISYLRIGGAFNAVYFRARTPSATLPTFTWPPRKPKKRSGTLWCLLWVWGWMCPGVLTCSWNGILSHGDLLAVSTPSATTWFARGWFDPWGHSCSPEIANSKLMHNRHWLECKGHTRLGRTEQPYSHPDHPDRSDALTGIRIICDHPCSTAKSRWSGMGRAFKLWGKVLFRPLSIGSHVLLSIEQ